MDAMGREAPTERVTELTRALQTLAGQGPIAARTLADKCRIGGSCETRRRRIRKAVQAARDAGARVCADGDGYWLARNAGEWHEYLEAVKRGARFKFVRVRRTQEAVTDRLAGQGKLFEAEPWWAMKP